MSTTIFFFFVKGFIVKINWWWIFDWGSHLTEKNYISNSKIVLKISLLVLTPFNDAQVLLKSKVSTNVCNGWSTNKDIVKVNHSSDWAAKSHIIEIMSITNLFFSSKVFPVKSTTIGSGTVVAMLTKKKDRLAKSSISTSLIVFITILKICS